ncbi:ankyrin [Anaeromyces robustus]|uniref:Ankyrin n=1 Tax=Anaeromyces robustus TaxID=1754192 RepID=A0A1Y1WR80_9FUNG|nr:ankyrin [Anaeromyces robustus]|eukprot:ORX75776.1 ankyrin [Anaeromyces robustus]
MFDTVSRGDIKNMYNLLWNENVSLHAKKDYYQEDLISLAAQNDRNDLIKLLMKMNLNPKTRNNYGVTPVHWAANNGNDYIIKELCNYGLTLKDLQKRDEFGSTPLHYAAVKNNENIVQLLVSAGIDPTVINNDGRRASDVTTDATIKKYLKDEENRYFAEHYKKKNKKKGKKKGNVKTPTKRSLSSASSKKSITTKQSSFVKSKSQIKPSTSTTIKRTTTPPKKDSIKPNINNNNNNININNNILPPTTNKNSVVASKKEKAILNPTSYTMKNINQEVITINNSAKNSRKNLIN